MAPEQFDGSASPASDVYALGTIIYQLLVGDVPYSGGNMAEFMMAKLQQPIPPMKALNPVCDSTELLENLVYAMLERRPEDRPTLEQVFDHLAQCEEEAFGSSAARVVGASGSRPIVTGSITPRSARHPSIGALKVPYTIVAPQPMGGSTQSSIATLNAITGPTHSAMSTSSAPSAPVRKTFPLPALLAIVFVLVSVGGAGIYFARARKVAPPSATGDVGGGAERVRSAGARLVRPPSRQRAHRRGGLGRQRRFGDDAARYSARPRDVESDAAGLPDQERRLRDVGLRARRRRRPFVEQVVTLAPETTKPGKSPLHAGKTPSASGGGKPAPSGGDSDIRLKR